MASICSVGGGGVVLPLGGDAEQEWPRGLRIVLYLLGLGWCFMGVAIIADVFMGAIEKVTSKKLRKLDKSTGRWYTYEVWNPTVANLTLMALGSSAPEILLNVIDIFAKEFFLEGLGPSTIVGSAAFNLLMIIAVCIISIEGGEVRFIKETTVYAITASFSIFAYIWLLAILLVFSPNVVEVWEGIITFLLFPVLTFLAWCADKGYFGKNEAKPRRVTIHEDMTKEEIAEAEAQVRKEHGENLSSDQIARILAVQNPEERTRAHYRVGAIRSLMGGKRVKNNVTRSITKLSFMGPAKVVPIDDEDNELIMSEPVKIEFPLIKKAVLENAGEVTVAVKRRGNLEVAAKVYYKTEDGEAKDGSDYTSVEGWLEFIPGQIENTITVKIIDDVAYEEDEDFYIHLSDPKVEGSKAPVRLGARTCTVTIIDDDDAGILSFPADTLTLYSKNEVTEHKVLVQRRNGGCGEVKVSYALEEGTAIPGHDFEGSSGVLTFESQQVEAWITVTVKPVPRYEHSSHFRILLSEPTGGAKLDETRDGGSDKNILTVNLEADPEVKQHIERVRSALQAKWDRSKVGHANWAQQFKEAILVNGGEDDDDDEGGDAGPPTMWDKAAHVVALPWKLLFALVPPTDYCGGWVCFYCALGMIGFVTMIIGDMASLLGCVLCIPDDITAITFVALGTSLPDTFASKAAATQDPHADASVGNVTGSNSVNVFLGLGLPWMIAALRWSFGGASAEWDARYQLLPDLDFLGSAGSRTQAFVVPAGNLAFSVAVFSGCAVTCIALLALRRKLFGGELGGPEVPKWGSAVFLCCLWFLYIILSAWQSLSGSGGATCR